MKQEYNYTPLPEPITITEQVWPEGTISLVSVVSTAYNHELYIRKCIEGFLIQKTTFPVELVIHDDASTDKTAEIIREYENKYPTLFKTIYQSENQYSKRVNIWNNLFTNHSKGKYIALCEGDDYWIDPLKLQKQVDFLEANPEYGMCCTSVSIFNQKFNKLISVKSKSQNKDITYLDLLNQNCIYTLTVVCRKNIIEEYQKSISSDIKAKWLMGDYPMWLWFSLKGKIYSFDFVSSVYRISANSVTHKKDETKRIRFFKNVFQIVDYYLENYPVSDEIKRGLYERRANNYIKKSVLLNNYSLYKEGIRLKKENTFKISFFDLLIFLFISNRVGRFLIQIYLYFRHDNF